MTLNETFAKAYKEGNISPLEISWSFGVEVGRIHELLEGAQYNEAEELKMLRFIFKNYKTEQKEIRKTIGLPVMPKLGDNEVPHME